MWSPTSMDNNIVAKFQLICFVKTISESFNVDALDILCGFFTIKHLSISSFNHFPVHFPFPLNKFPHLIKISEEDSSNSNKTQFYYI